MGVLKAKVNGVWEPVAGVPVIPNEVYISPTDPLLTDPLAELWYDTSVTPGVLKANNAGVWEAVTTPPTAVPEEVIVGPEDPYIIDPLSTAELWFDEDAPDTWIPQGPTGDTGPTGPTGPTGSPGGATIIVGDFGVSKTPADLPPDGFLPADWDAPGSPATDRQTALGQSLYYDRAADPLDGHLFQYVSTAVDASGWLDIGLVQGPTGPTGPSLPASVVIPGVFVNGFFGTAEFKVSDAAVTMTLLNVQRSSVHGDGQIKILNYPAGVPAPWAEQRALNHGMLVKSNGFIDLRTPVFSLVLARPDGVNLGIMSNSADWTTDQAINVQMTWVV